MAPQRVTGVLLAAGAGRRAGGPKALRHDADGTSWLVRSAEVLLQGGCTDVVVVLGCSAAEARGLLPAVGHTPDRLTVVEADDWADGMSRSLTAGLVAAAAGADAVLVHLVDLPDVTAAVVGRVLSVATGPEVLARARYAGRPGHPVLIGADHLTALLAELDGAADTGAKAYLDRHGARVVDCTDLASGEDRDGLG